VYLYCFAQIARRGVVDDDIAAAAVRLEKPAPSVSLFVCGGRKLLLFRFLLIDRLS